MGLSILMTTASTLAAIVMTPLLTTWLAGTLVPVDPRALFTSTLQVVLAPVVLGAFLNQSFPSTVSRVARFSPAVATLLISLIVGSTLAHNADSALRCGGQLFATVAALHGAGFVIGYSVSKALGLSNKIARTNSIEVGMQNATLGAVLAALHFSDPLVAAPCAVSSCTQSVMGSLIAAYWRAPTPEDEGDTGTSVPMAAA
jgi:BASS family bile acid:Na+ symporter